VVVVSDDLGISTTAPTITVTKGAPCADASTCAKGQKCEAGKCFWDPPVGLLGDACEYAQFCESGICLETTDGNMCSQDCIVAAEGACPEDYVCVPAGNSGACVPDTAEPGCCSVRGSDNQAWWHFGLSAAILGFVVRRRRRR
jgi:MYXO-CTERM domain-containing protein